MELFQILVRLLDCWHISPPPQQLQPETLGIFRGGVHLFLVIVAQDKLFVESFFPQLSFFRFSVQKKTIQDLANFLFLSRAGGWPMAVQASGPHLCCCCYTAVTKSCQTLLQPPGLKPTRLLCPWDFPGKNTGVGCHFLLQGMIILTQGSNPHLLHWQAESLPLSHQGSPTSPLPPI